jgi:enoyl-CoA hydratase/carnithine racemase
MSYESLRFDVRDDVALVTFATPSALNSISEQRLDELDAVLARVEADETIGALILTGEGERAFCVGLDLDLLEKAFGDFDEFDRIVGRVARIVEKLERICIPTIAAVNGVARAGGFEMAVGCDVIIMADEAKIGDAHTNSGVMPACVCHRLAQRIGEMRARTLVFSARWLNGPEAVAWGLALESVPRIELLARAHSLALSFTAQPRAVIAAAKKNFTETKSLSVEDATAVELRNFSAYMRHEPYGVEGYRAFREGRKPTWLKANHGR